jgi:peptidoglycan hydrolase-like protein with peptidoglycan-binding domain
MKVIKKGDRGKHVKVIQKALDAKGYWTYDGFTDYFGGVTHEAVIEFQEDNGLVDDGKVGSETLKKLGLSMEDVRVSSGFDEKYKGVTIEGSVFPDKPIKDSLRVALTKELKNEYLPALDKAMGDDTLGFRLLCIIMAKKEGFYKGTRSYRYNNPGNIGNTDSGANKGYPTLEAGILRQKEYITQIAKGQHRAYPMGRLKTIKPYYSKEIAKNAKLYGMSPYVPGYKFTFTGQLDQFVKIYSTGARAGNGYLSMIISYFKQNGLNINAQTKIQDIIKMNGNGRFR